MTYKFLVLLSSATLALAACGKHDNASTGTGADNATDVNATATDNGIATDNGMAANGAATAPAPTTEQAFVNAAAASDRFEIESSKLAQSSATSSAVKKFAAQMISAHTASTDKLKSTVARLSPPLTPDDTLAPDQQQTLDSLKGLKGSAFDSAYVKAQQDGHQKTLDALKTYSASGDNATLKSFANGMIPTVTAHLNLARGLK